MKSENAKYIFNTYGYDYYSNPYGKMNGEKPLLSGIIDIKRANEAIEFVEQDARDRAIEALCETCTDARTHLCPQYSYNEHRLCRKRDSFLEHYDK